MPIWVLWTACGGFLILRGLLAAAESALYGTSDERAQELSVSHPRRGRRLLHLKTERESTGAGIRAGMVVSGSLAAALGVWIFLTLWTGELPSGGWRVGALAVGVSAVLVGFTGNLIDVSLRSAASGRPDAWALGLSGLVSLSRVVFAPVTRVLVWSLNLALRPLGSHISLEPPPPPLEELEKLLAERAAQEKVDEGAPQLIRSIFELSDKTCRDVMVPRTEVIALDISTPTDKILRILSEENHSRMPVYETDIDRIIGILHVRDLLPMVQHPELIVLRDLLRPAQFVPWVKPIGDLLREMQARRIHTAMVVDEYGGFMGIVTLEDILREIVGDIGDEFEEVVKEVEKQQDGSFLVDAAMGAEDFSQAFDVKLPEGDFETVGGFLSSLAGRIPDVGERFSYQGWSFTVHTKDGPRIDRVKLGVSPVDQSRPPSAA